MKFVIEEEVLGKPIMLNEYDCDGYEQLGFDLVTYEVDDTKALRMFKEFCENDELTLDNLTDYLLDNDFDEEYFKEEYGDYIRTIGKEIDREEYSRY